MKAGNYYGYGCCRRAGQTRAWIADPRHRVRPPPDATRPASNFDTPLIAPGPEQRRLHQR